ncbi:hypothetical protein NE237_008813 [Protea cynaroides]|uniref:Mitochondrial import inner membrane translocase subunit n=1 Tax=Protea cynaroides TaxID=273540 RepID=A0A9Q0KWD6_9MAGN|nr:hypothetical protein NE237_008813 [Protea cynaroides]
MSASQFLKYGFLWSRSSCDLRRILKTEENFQQRDFFDLHCYGLMASNNSPTAFDKAQIFGMAEKEMEYRVELFNKLTHTCFNKCIEKRYKDSELNLGENSCIDRCVSKYWQVTNLVGQLLGSSRPPM